MRAIDLSNITWRRSSYSNSDGGNCFEVSDDLLRTGRRHKSRHGSEHGGGCLEAAAGTASLVPVRDSKDPDRGAPLLTASAWSAFIDGVAR